MHKAESRAAAPLILAHWLPWSGYCFDIFPHSFLQDVLCSVRIYSFFSFFFSRRELQFKRKNKQSMEDKRKKRSPKVSLPQPPPPPINPRKLSVLPASKSATFSLGLPQPPSPKNRNKYKRSIGAPGQPKEAFTTVAAPPKITRCVTLKLSAWNLLTRGLICDAFCLQDLTGRSPGPHSQQGPAKLSSLLPCSTLSLQTFPMWERWREASSTFSTTFTQANCKLSVR